MLQIFGLLMMCMTNVNGQDPGSTVGSTGSVTFTYGGVSTTHTSVRAADGNIWLQQNLGSTQVATSATDVASYGDLFQWGRWIDGHQFRTSTLQQVTTLTNNTPAGIASGLPNFLRNNVQPLWWGGSSSTTPAGSPQITDTWAGGLPTTTNGTDPCETLGAGWRMATKGEWDAVRLAEGITNLATGFTSNLKLSYSGHRNGANGSVQGSGSANLFWTSTNFSSAYPYAIYNGGSVNNWSRGYGGSCRCIKESIPLKIKLSSFNAINEGSSNRIDWKSESEASNASYIVERSSNGRDYAAICTIYGKGVSALYNYRDETPENGINYYRLKMADADGDNLYSHVMSAVVNVKSSLAIEVYPNPVYEKLTINIKGTPGNGQRLTVTDVTGKFIRILQIVGQSAYIDMKDLPTGVYMIRYTDGNQTCNLKVSKK